MDNKILLQILIEYFSSEISNKMTFDNDNIEIALNNGQKIKIYEK